MKKLINFLLLPFKVAVRPFYLFGLDDLAAVALIGAAVSAGVSLYNNYQTRKTNKSNVKEQNKANQVNLDFANTQFQEQQYLNRNQIQLQAADAQKAGINPLALNSGVLSAGSYSSQQSAATQVAPQIDISPISELMGTLINVKSQQKIADRQAKSAENVAKINAKSAENVARINAQNQQEMLATRLTQEDRQFQEKLAQDFSIANIQAELERQGLEQQKSIEAAKRVSEQLQRDDDYRKAQEYIRLEEEKIKNAKDAAERDAAVRSSNGWKAFAASVFHTVVNSVTTTLTGRPVYTSSNRVGFDPDRVY